MTKLNSKIVDNLISEEKLIKMLKTFEVVEYCCDDIKMKQYNSSTIWGKDDLVGRNFKRFFRYSGSCFDDIKQELLTNRNSCYVTYFNNVAREGLVPEWVSVLVKASDKFRTYREVLTSQILNYCEVPTCANLSLYDEDKKAERNLVSIDTISENERFLNSEDLRIKNLQGALHTWVETFSKSLSKQPIIKKNPEMKDKLLKELVYSVLIRRVLIGDTDCQPWNIGFLANEKEKYLKLINFDYECAFGDSRLSGYAEKDIDYAKKNFPEEYNKFLQKINEILSVLPKIKLDYSLIQERLTKNIEYIKSISQHTM